MSSAPHERRTAIETGPDTRRHFRRLWDVAFIVLRFIARHAHNAYATFGIFVLIGAAIAIAGTWGFAELAGHVSSGGTQAFDDTILQWLGQHRTKSLDAFMLDITSLGTSSVVAMVVGVAALFLWLNQHKHSAILLLVSTAGGVLLNNLLKLGFARPRPDIISWVTTATFYSFPSGHAMSATVVYSTVAYLAGRLQRTHRARVAVALVAALVIAIICLSRLYLGVHYPSDVLAGIIIGLAWAGFCMATLEVIQLYARRNAPEMLEEEHPAPLAEG
ncbi:MAG TPA: phosphatase PAP2 family protein [Gemmatimonadaceae bacterium]|jgi:undecaprenyl-diphosphatase